MSFQIHSPCFKYTHHGSNTLMMFQIHQTVFKYTKCIFDKYSQLFFKYTCLILIFKYSPTHWSIKLNEVCQIQSLNFQIHM